MFQRDYILRLIEEMGQALALIIELRRNGRYQESLAAIDDTMGRVLGVGLAEVEAMPADQLVGILRFVWSEPPANTLLVERFLVLAKLLQEAAEIAAAENYPIYRDNRRLKALQLYLAVATEDDPGNEEAVREIEPLLDQLDEHEFPADTKDRLWQFFEQRGDFARAENWLFDLLEDGQVADDAIERGIAFFDRLLASSDAELLAGNLPREEVLAGLAELRRIQDGRSSGE